MLYVNVYGAVPFAPVKVIVAEGSLTHSVVVPAIVAVGRTFTVTVTWAVLTQPFASVPVTVKTVDPTEGW